MKYIVMTVFVSCLRRPSPLSMPLGARHRRIEIDASAPEADLALSSACKSCDSL